MPLFPTLLIGAALAQAPRLSDLKATAEQNPESAAAQSNYGTGLKAAGRLDEAMERFEVSLSLDPTYARAYNNMGNAFQALGDYEQAVAAHGLAIALMPGLASAYSNIGNALRELGEPAKAVEALTSAVALNPVYPAAYTNLGSATLALGDAHNAARWHALACALTGFRDPSSLNNLGAALEADGRLDEAQMAFEGALEVQDASAVLHLNRGNILRKLGRLSEAVSSYTRSLEIEPDGADAATAYNNVAAALQAEGNLERAMQAYDAALDLAPAHPTAAANRDKLPISPAYRDAAARESRILASRAARVLLATHAAARRRGGRAASDAAPPLSPVLHRLTRYLRRLETKQLPDDSLGSDLWNGRAGDMPSAMGTSSSSTEDGSRFTVGAFAWGGVWYHTLAATFTHPQARLALSKPGATAVVLGSSIGFEAYFAALTFAIPTVGVELLCSLTRISTDVGRAHAVPASLARFECADALSFRLPHSAAFVYVDDTAWDAPTIRQLAAKLGRELPSGAIVVHNSQVGYEDTSAERFLKLQDYEVGTSWNPRHKVYVHSVV